MKSQASDTTLVGGGRRAPGSEQRSCQTNSVTAMHDQRRQQRRRTSCRAASPHRARATGRTGGRKATISAVAPGTGHGGRDGRGVGLACSRHHATFLICRRGEIGLGIRGIEHLAVEEGLLAARRGLGNVGVGGADVLGGLAPQVLAIDLADDRLGVEVSRQLAPALVLGEEPQLVALVGIRDAALPELHQLVGALDLAAVAVVDVALDAVDDVGRRHVEPLALADDVGHLLLVLHLVAPLLGLHHGHQHGHGGLGVLVDPVGAHAERLLGMVLPDLAGHAGGVADVLVHELVVPRLADAEGVHVADLHVGHHLRRRHDDGRDVLVGIDAAGGQPVADPQVVRAAGEGHGALHFLAGRLLLGEGFLERRRVGLGAAALELVGDGDALALVG